MKIQTLISMAMAAVMMAACSYEDELSAPLQKGVLTASVEGSRSTTRAGFDADGKFYWSAIDYLGVTTSGNKASFSSLELKTGGGTASATFEGTVNGAIEGYAVYPYNDVHSMSGTELTYNFPSSYTYNKVDADYFTTTQGEGNSFNPAMWGSIVNGSVQLKHLGGVFCIKIEKMPVTAGKLTLTTDKQIAGRYKVDLNTDKPVLTATESSDTDNTVTIKFSKATQNSPGVFYVPVPTGTYNSVRIKVIGEDGSEKTNVAAGTYTIARQDLKKIELSNGSIDATVPKTSTDLSEAQNNLASSDAVSVTGEISSTNTIDIPGVSSSTGVETSKSLSLEQVASEASLTVNDDNNSGDATNSVNNFTLSIPNNETQGFDPLDVTINMPNTTVTLAGNGGVATYGTVTASTADNTLVLSSGVEVREIIVNKGNVRVNKGAELVAIEKGDGNDATVTIYKEEGATLPESLGTGFVVVDAAVADMATVGASGGTYTLPCDVDIQGHSIMIKEGKNVTLDLNGHTITADNSTSGNIRVLGTFTLKDTKGTGKIVAAQDYTSTYSTGIIRIEGSDAQMTMESGLISVVRTDKGQFGVMVSNGGHFTMTGGKIEAGWYAVSGNGNDKTNMSNIMIQGGELISTSDYAIYLPHLGNTTISGGTVNGAAGAVSIQRGTLNISNDANIMSLGTGDTGEWGDGTGNQPNCALMVAAEYGDCTINITGGNFSAEGNAILLGTGSTSNNVKINVSGGTFSDPSALAYLTDGADVDVVLNSDVTLNQSMIVHVPATVRIDLSDNKLTFSEDARVNIKEAAVTFQNGEIEANNLEKVNHDLIEVGTDGSVLLDEITLTTNGAGVGTAISENNSSIEVRNSTINVTSYSISTNASMPVPTGVKITLTNSTFIGSDPLLLNIPCDVVIDKCVMNGTMHGMVLRGGTATVKNSTITLNYPDNDYEEMSSYFNGRNWGSGNEINLAALTIGNKSPKAYQYPTVITLVNTTVQSTGDHAEYFPALYAYANSGDGLGVTLKYDNHCTFTGDIKYGSTNITVNESPVSPESNN